MFFDWNPDKDRELRESRNISFSQIIVEIEAGNFRIQSPHPNIEKYPNQILFYVLLEDYVYVVPAVKDGNIFFLKTIYPSRRQTKAYREGRLII